jgi:hypothetical protein
MCRSFRKLRVTTMPLCDACEAHRVSLKSIDHPTSVSPARESKGPASRPVLRWFVVDGIDYGLEIVPPFVTVSADVSWQLAAISRCAGLVLSYETFHENVSVAVCAVVFDVETVCGLAPDTPTVVL